MKFFIERIRHFLRLSHRERGIFTRAWVLFLLVELALRFLPFKRVVALGQRLSPRRPGDATPPFPCALPRAIWLVEVAGRHAPGGPSCLNRALVLSWILRRRGVPTTLRIGVSRDGGGLEAHAWLEGEGQVILGPGEGERYHPLLPEGVKSG